MGFIPCLVLSSFRELLLSLWILTANYPFFGREELELNSQNSIPGGKLGIRTAGGGEMEEISGDFGEKIQIWLIFPFPLGRRENRVGFSFLGFVVTQNILE